MPKRKLDAKEAKRIARYIRNNELNTRYVRVLDLAGFAGGIDISDHERTRKSREFTKALDELVQSASCSAMFECYADPSMAEDRYV